MNRTLFTERTCTRHHARALDRGVVFELRCVRPYDHEGRCLTTWTETNQQKGNQ